MSYTINILGDSSRDWIDGNANGLGNIALTSGGIFGIETNTFTTSGAPTAAFLQTEMVFSNFSDVEGTLLNPTGTASSPGDWPFTVGFNPNETVTTQWTTQSFGFDSAGDYFNNVKEGEGAISRWDEWTFDVTQSYEVVPEPSSTLLLGLGGLSLILRRRK